MLTTGSLTPQEPHHTLVSNDQQILLQKDQTRGSGYTAEADEFLKYNRNFPPQQGPCSASDFVLNRSDQLRPGSHDVASQDENLGIERMQKAHQGGSQILQCSINDIACAFIPIGSSTEDRLRIWYLAGTTYRQFCRRGPVHVCPIIGFDGT